MRERKSSETKVAKEYCWVMTQALGSEFTVDQNPVFWTLDYNWTPFCVCVCVYVCVCVCVCARARMLMFTYMYILSCDYSFPACKNCDLHQTYQNVTTYLISQKGLETKEIFRYHFTFFRLQASKYRVSSLCDLYNVVVISSCCIAWNFTIIGEKGIGRVAEGRRCGHER